MMAVQQYLNPDPTRDVFTVYLDGVRQVNEVHRGDLSNRPL